VNANSKPGPLAGIRILDFTQLVQGAMATQVLGDLGADVVKIEKVGGEWMRHWGIFDSRTHGEVDSFLAFNRNKRSVIADLKDPDMTTRFLDMADDIDVVTENFRPGVMERLGLGYEAFAARNPGIIYASATGYGPTGPYSMRPGQDLLVQSLSGLLHLTGREGDPPTPCGVGISDEFSALYMAIAILGALVHRERTGQGQSVAVDLFGCTVSAQQQELTAYLNHHLDMPRPRANIGHVGATGPFGVYATADGYVALAMMHCPTLGKILDVSWLAEFDTNEKMFENRDHIHSLLASHFRGQHTAPLLELLNANDVWCARVNSYSELESDPQVLHKCMFWDVSVGGDGAATFRTVGSPMTFSLTPATLHRGVPRAGQHNSEFFTDKRRGGRLEDSDGESVTWRLT